MTDLERVREALVMRGTPGTVEAIDAHLKEDAEREALAENRFQRLLKARERVAELEALAEERLGEMTLMAVRLQQAEARVREVEAAFFRG